MVPETDVEDIISGTHWLLLSVVSASEDREPQDYRRIIKFIYKEDTRTKEHELLVETKGGFLFF